MNEEPIDFVETLCPSVRHYKYLTVYGWHVLSLDPRPIIGPINEGLGSTARTCVKLIVNLLVKHSVNYQSGLEHPE